MAGPKWTNPVVLRLPSLLQAGDPGCPCVLAFRTSVGVWLRRAAIVDGRWWCIGASAAVFVCDADRESMQSERYFEVFGCVSDWKVESKQDILAFNLQGNCLVL